MKAQNYIIEDDQRKVKKKIEKNSAKLLLRRHILVS